MRQRQAEKYALRLRIHVRRALAGQIRQEKQAVSADRAGSYLAVDFIIVGVMKHLLRDPFQGNAGIQACAHQVPAVLHRVGEGICTKRSIVHGLAHGCGNLSRRADVGCKYAILHDAVAHRHHALIRAAVDHAGRFAKPGIRGCLRRNVTDDLRRRRAFGHQTQIQPQRVQERFRPAKLHVIKGKAARSVGIIGDNCAAQPEFDVILRHEHLAYLRVKLRPAGFQPIQCRNHEARGDAVLRLLRDEFRAQLFVDFVDGFAAALIQPYHGVHHRLVFLIQRNQAVHLTGKADRFDFLRINAGGLNRAADTFAGFLIPGFGILLRIARLRDQRFIGFLRRG